MFDKLFKPERSKESLNWGSIGGLGDEFEAFKPNPQFSWDKWGNTGNDNWPFVTPKTAPPVGDLPKMIEDILRRVWTSAKPTNSAVRVNSRGTAGMNVSSGQHRQGAAVAAQNYQPQVRPTHQEYVVGTPITSAIATDWKVFEQVKRMNAVTFRGDTRPPREVLGMGGFTPPNSRTDRFYLENNIYHNFSKYLERRFRTALDKNTFLGAVDAAAPTAAQKKLLVDYMMWRRVLEGEAFHLGRMVENECEKGYISTSRAIGSALTFGTRYGKTAGWIYVTIVHGGFVVPFATPKQKQIHWGSKEAEIAQWGPIPSERIVGFFGVSNDYLPMTDLYFRRSFRKKENAAFEYMYNVMSGMLPGQPGFTPPN